MYYEAGHYTGAAREFRPVRSAFQVAKNCLRYVVPFVLEDSFDAAVKKVELPLHRFMETEGSCSKIIQSGEPCWVRKLAADACPDGSYYGIIQARLNKSPEEKDEDSKTKAVYGLYGRRERDLYDFLRNEFCFDSAEGQLGPEKIGCEWLDIQSVTAGLEALNILRERRADEEEKRRDNRISAIVGLFALLGVFSAWTDGLDFLSKIVQDGKIVPLSILQAGLVLLVLIVAVVALVITVRSFLINREEK